VRPTFCEDGGRGTPVWIYCLPRRRAMSSATPSSSA
jgi:hypothetical protein